MDVQGACLLIYFLVNYNLIILVIAVNLSLLDGFFADICCLFQMQRTFFLSYSGCRKAVCSAGRTL